MYTTVSNFNKFWMMMLTAGTLWAGVGLGTALADFDAKDYPATLCRTSSKFMFGVSQGIDVYNKSTSQSLHVTCPIIRDYLSRDATMEYVAVKYYNPYFKDRQVSCRLDRVTPAGKLAGSSKNQHGTSRTPGGTITLKFPSRRGTLTARGAGNYVVSCTLPRSGGTRENQRVRLSGYTAWEKN